MSNQSVPHRFAVSATLYSLLNPIPFGFFVAALIFDATYVRSDEPIWVKSAAWLIAMGLLFAVIPRLINLVQVWITLRSTATTSDRFDFWLNFLAVAAAIANSFVHSRDAYAVVPAGVWLSACTVILLALASVLVATNPVTAVRVVRA